MPSPRPRTQNQGRRRPDHRASHPPVALRDCPHAVPDCRRSRSSSSCPPPRLVKGSAASSTDGRNRDVIWLTEVDRFLSKAIGRPKKRRNSRLLGGRISPNSGSACFRGHTSSTSPKGDRSTGREGRFK